MNLMPHRPVDREILRLAIPALGALVAEPIFLLADSAMVGHLGVDPLAGLGIASAVLQTVVGLMVFLAYSTTPAVARRVGAGDERGAVAAGVDGCWLALGLGIVLDGVLIGAGDARYLALTGLVNAAVFVPLAVAAAMWGGRDLAGLSALTAAFTFGYLGVRALTLGIRARGRVWMRAGATV